MSYSFEEDLKKFSLTGIEATVYETLLKHGAMTGYEVAKETGISRSNVYSSLSGLVDKGAAYLSEGDSTRYIPVAIDVFTQNLLRDLTKTRENLIKNAPKKVEKTEGYITVSGERHIKDKIFEMLNDTKLRVYFMAENGIIKEYEDLLKSLSTAGKKVVVLSDDVTVPGAIFYKTEPIPGQIRLITDSSFVLTGSLSGRDDDTCLYSDQPNLVTVLKEALKNRISLIEIEEEIK